MFRPKQLDEILELCREGQRNRESDAHDRVRGAKSAVKRGDEAIALLEGLQLATGPQIQAARDLYQNLEIQIYDDATVAPCEDDAGSVWVQAWVYVHGEELEGSQCES